MAEAFGVFRLNPELCGKLKELASMSGYTVTAAFEKFIRFCLWNSPVVFPVSSVCDGLRKLRLRRGLYRLGYWREEPATAWRASARN